jgi:hypothetical protein
MARLMVVEVADAAAHAVADPQAAFGRRIQGAHVGGEQDVAFHAVHAFVAAAVEAVQAGAGGQP